MEREIKIGLSVIGLLLMVFAGLIVKRVRDAYADDRRPTPAAHAEAASPTTLPATVLRAESRAEEPNAVQAAAWNEPDSAGPPRFLPDPLTLEREAVRTGDSFQQPPASRYGDLESPTPALPPSQFEQQPLDAAEKAQPIQRYQENSFVPEVRAEDSSTLPREQAWQFAQATTPIPAGEAAPGGGASRYGDALPAEMATPPQPRAAVQEPAPIAQPQPQPLPAEPLRPAPRFSESPAPLGGTGAPYYEAGPPRFDANTQPAAGSLPPASTGVAPQSPPQPQRVTPVGGRYTVQPNDNFWLISQKVYGTGGFFKALAAYNHELTPDGKLDVGDSILVPGEQELRSKFAGLCPKPRRPANVQLTAGPASMGRRTYTVQPGDSLFEIARWELGDAERWYEIYLLNKARLGEDLHYLPLGFELLLPVDDEENVDPIARRQE